MSQADAKQKARLLGIARESGFKDGYDAGVREGAKDRDLLRARCQSLEGARDRLAEALRYARRFLREADHDTAYVDAALASINQTDDVGAASVTSNAEPSSLSV